VRYEQSTGSSLETNSSFSAPVKTDYEYTIGVTDNDRAGDAITRISGLAIFIKKYKYKRQKRKDQD
jgi:predicted RNA-binding protein with TRAM domain